MKRHDGARASFLGVSSCVVVASLWKRARGDGDGHAGRCPIWPCLRPACPALLASRLSRPGLQDAGRVARRLLGVGANVRAP